MHIIFYLLLVLILEILCNSRTHGDEELQETSTGQRVEDVGGRTDTIPLEAIQLDNNLTFEEKPVKILEFDS